MTFLFFFNKITRFYSKKNLNEYLSHFLEKNGKNVAHKKTHWLKLELCFIDSKKENVILHTFAAIVSTNSIHFLEKIVFKNMLKSLNLVRKHLRIASIEIYLHIHFQKESRFALDTQNKNNL